MQHPSSIYLILILVFSLYSCQKSEEKSVALAPDVTIELSSDVARQTAQEIRETTPGINVVEGLELSLWASDSLAPDPITIKMDNQGRAYLTRTNRQKNSEFDIRGHMDWATQSISWQTVEDRRAFLHKHFATENSDENDWLKDLNEDGVHDWHDLTVEKEQVYRLEDRDRDGIADFSRLFLEDFNDEVADPAGAIVPFGDDVFIGAGPDLWRVTDVNKDGIADEKTSISHGYAVHVGFSGHGMSGLKVGPDGKIYWGIGDIGMNVKDQEGKQWSYPNQGVIVRCNPDGSDFEVYAAGLRNTHEFVFDKYGNIITEDNDGDHPGESERLMYVVHGHDAGWRANWQYGKYTDPDNNNYKVWMDEKLSIPRHEEQAAYIIPPIRNYHNGPTGMSYYPGTGLSEKYQDHFFIAEFPGTPSRANIWAFRLEPDGAGFAFKDEEKVLSGVLATGIDFGPDGALYLADWINGWGTKNRGRVWKLDDPRQAGNAEREAVKQLLASDFSEKEVNQLGELLKHADQRVRQKAQFELVKRAAEGKDVLKSYLAADQPQLARIHALWGVTQLARLDESHATELVPLLDDQDIEVRAQAAKMLGDIRYAAANDKLIELLKDEARVRFFAAEALGRTKAKDAVEPLIQLLRENKDEDVYLRHAATLALGKIGNTSKVIALKNDPSRAVRIGAVVALRRMRSSGVAAFLQDKDEYIVTEAARAINDDESIGKALTDLADLLTTTRFKNEALIRRAINANLRMGQPKNIEALLAYAENKQASTAMRAEAIAALGTWSKPSVMDRVDGFYRGEVTRDPAVVSQAAGPTLARLLADKNPEIQAKAAIAAGKLAVRSSLDALLALTKNSDSPAVRSAAVEGIATLKSPERINVLKTALQDQEEEVRVTALRLMPEQDLPPEELLDMFRIVLEKASLKEQQTALKGLGELPAEKVSPLLHQLIDQLKRGDLPPGLELELQEVIAESEGQNVKKTLNEYNKSLNLDDPVVMYSSAIEGGDYRNGWWLFQSHETSQCSRCHGWEAGKGSDVGPNLHDIADRYDKVELLRSLVAPSAKIAPGYGTVYVALKDGTELSGILAAEDENSLSVELEGEEIREVSKSEIAERIDAASSMPAMGELLEPGEMRDILAFLGRLKSDK